MFNFFRFTAVLSVSFCLTLAGPVGAAALYPQGSQFCFTFYSTKTNDALSVLSNGATSTNDSTYILTNGVTALGPYYGDQTSPLADAAGYATKYIYKVSPPCMSNAGAAVFDSGTYVWPSDQTITNQVAAIVAAAQTNANIAIWDFEPEELRPWKPNELHYFQIVSAAIHGSDPTNRPIYNYQPNNRDIATLTNFAAYENICTKGMYVSTITDDLGNSCLTNRIWARWSMEQELGAIAAANTSAVPWIHLWMAADPPVGYTATDITNWCRHDAYMGLIKGGKGIEVWSGFEGRSGFADTNFYAYLKGYLSVARDLNGPGPLRLAPVFLFGQKQTNVSMTVNSGPNPLILYYDSITNNYPPVTYLATVYTGTNYLFMVNSAGQSVTTTFSGVPLQNRVDLFAGDTNATPGGSFQVTLPAYGVKAFQFAMPPAPSIAQTAVTNHVLTLGGTGSAGWNFVLQTTTNLVPAAAWTPVATNPVGGSAFTFTNLQMTNSLRRFYRVSMQ